MYTYSVTIIWWTLFVHRQSGYDGFLFLICITGVCCLEVYNMFLKYSTFDVHFLYILSVQQDLGEYIEYMTVFDKQMINFLSTINR